MRGLPCGSAGLPRRGAPRNDNGGTGMGEMLRVTVFGRIPCAVIASPLRRGNCLHFLSLRATTWRGNPVGDVVWDAGAWCGLPPYANAGLPRRGAPRNDKRRCGSGNNR
jgi:hypothetical protein